MAGMRGKETVRDMVLSLAAVGAVVGCIYVFAIPHDDSKTPAQRVGYRTELITARRAAPYPVAAPAPGRLSHDWRATSVSYTPSGEDQAGQDQAGEPDDVDAGGGDGGSTQGAAWHLGFLDPHDQYVAIEQSDGTPGPFIDDVTQHAKKTSRTQRIHGHTWTRYTGPKYDALVRRQPKVTTVVTGTASFRGLTTMAAALDASGPSPQPSTPTSHPASPSAHGH